MAFDEQNSNQEVNNFVVQAPGKFQWKLREKYKRI